VFVNPPWELDEEIGQHFESCRRTASTIKIEIVYNMYCMRRFSPKSRMRRLLSLGPPNYAIHGTYKSELDREPPISNLSKGVRGFYSPPGRV
jgi:hypothetical protein